MSHRFQRHYTREEARALIPQMRLWLQQLSRFREEVERYDRRLQGMNTEGQDTGGEMVNQWIRALAGMQSVLGEFLRREIFIKDLSRGLVDIPSLIGEKEVFLCWESDEEDIEFWHDLDTGYGGRERLE